MKKILIVEDDQKIGVALSVRLKAAGYEVVLATDAMAGSSLAVKHKPDLMILDVTMPAGTGLLVAERSQTNPTTAGTPFIILTASKNKVHREKAEELGAAAFFEKPYEADELLAA